MNFLMVGLGGGAGAMLRYAVSQLSFRGSFPFATLLVNFFGAVAIGFLAARAGKLSPKAMLFFKTGVCGGFTTFSTFSLEAYGLAQQGKPGLAGLYVLLSVGLCLGGVGIGMYLGGRWRAA